jgi:hypothetical protein
MPSVVFVHGTSVRYDGYAKTFAVLQHRLSDRRPDLQLVPCAWGNLLGSPPLDDLSLVPSNRWDGAGAAEPAGEPEAHLTQARQMVLDLEPFHELRALALLWSERSTPGNLFWGQSAVSRFQAAVQAMSTDPDLCETLRAAGVAVAFAEVLSAIASSDVVQDCLAGIRDVDGPDWAQFADCFTHAVLAETFRVAAPPSPQQFSLEFRNALAVRMLDLLRARQLGLPRKIAGRAGGLLVGGLGKLVQHWRGPFSMSVQPFVGDIFRYLAFGEALRRYIADTVTRARPPVVLVGHSLGGIACLDLLARQPQVPVAHLVTVGSQGSQLYRMGALPGLPDGAALPADFPAWTNVYSPHDLLSYLAAPLFGRHVVTDVEIRGARMMPAAHSSYFEQDAFYRLLTELIGTETTAAM